MVMQQESFATCSVSDISDERSVTTTIMNMYRLGWDQLVAARENKASTSARTARIVVTTVHPTLAVNIGLESLANEIIQLRCSEAKVHAKDALKCIITDAGERCVMTDLPT